MAAIQMLGVASRHKQSGGRLHPPVCHWPGRCVHHHQGQDWDLSQVCKARAGCLPGDRHVWYAAACVGTRPQMSLACHGITGNYAATSGGQRHLMREPWLAFNAHRCLTSPADLWDTRISQALGALVGSTAGITKATQSSPAAQALPTHRHPPQHTARASHQPRDRIETRSTGMLQVHSGECIHGGLGPSPCVPGANTTKPGRPATARQCCARQGCRVTCRSAHCAGHSVCGGPSAACGLHCCLLHV